MARCCSRQGKPAEALAAFEATMRKEPNRLNATLGAANAAAASGDNAKARQYFAAATALASDASVDAARDRQGARVPGEREIAMAGSMMAGMRTVVVMAVWTMALGATFGRADPRRHRSGRNSGRVGTDRDRDGTGGRRRTAMDRSAQPEACRVSAAWTVRKKKPASCGFEVSDPPGEATATLLIDGTACTFSGTPHGRL